MSAVENPNIVLDEELQKKAERDAQALRSFLFRNVLLVIFSIICVLAAVGDLLPNIRYVVWIGAVMFPAMLVGTWGSLIFLLITKQKERFWSVIFRMENPDPETVPAALRTVHDISKHATGQDVAVSRLIRAEPIFLLPFLVCIPAMIISVVGFFVLVFANENALELLFGNSLYGLGAFLLLLHVGLGFIIGSFIFLSFLFVGELFQRKFTQARHSIMVDMVRNCLHSIPFVLIFSLLWAVFIFVNQDQDDNEWELESQGPIGLSTLLSFSVLLVAFKYFTYINLAAISFEDKRISLREAWAFMVEHKKQLLRKWISTGFSLAIPVSLFMLFFLWNEYTHTFSISEFALFFTVPTVALILIVRLISEQIAVSLFFIAKRHPNIVRE